MTDKENLIKACEGLQDDLAEAVMWKYIYKTMACGLLIILACVIASI